MTLTAPALNVSVVISVAMPRARDASRTGLSATALHSQIIKENKHPTSVSGGGGSRFRLLLRDTKKLAAKVVAATAATVPRDNPKSIYVL